MIKFLDETMGLTQHQIENIYSRRDNVVKVWLKPLVETEGGDEIEAISYWVGIDNQRFGKLAEGFQDLCNLIQPSQDGRDISGRIIDGFGPVIGAFANESDQDFYRKRPLAQSLSLPFVERSEYLALSPGQIEDIILSNDEVVLGDMRGAFCRTAYLLDNVGGNYRFSVLERGRERAPKISELDVNDIGVIIGSGLARVETGYEWVVKVDRGEGVVFLPFEYFP